MSDLVYKEESYRIMGACFQIYKEKGCGFLEPVYQECMEIELTLQGIQFIPKRSLGLSSKGRAGFHLPRQDHSGTEGGDGSDRRTSRASLELPESHRIQARLACELRP